MKKLYAIYATIELIEKPAWFDAFCAQYNRPHPLHVTLKQMAYIDHTQLPAIQEVLESILESKSPKRNDLQIVFDTYVFNDHDEDDGTGWMYVFASQRNKLLGDLQRAIREQLAGYSDYYFASSETYEYDFKPHITIAGELDTQAYDRALAELPESIRCVGQVTDITLSCVNEPTLEEANDPENLRSYLIDN
jgi:2'-5' RNA ligase